jgi:geranylgeranyl pyrophosphate synthase
MNQAVRPIQEPPGLLEILEREHSTGELALGLGLGRECASRELLDSALLDPLREYLARPGKEFRARLVRGAWRIAGGRGRFPSDAPLLVEVLHAGSLVIDDIQDGSAYRRGGAALHRLIGDPLAINAGNWLYFFAERLVGRLGVPALVELDLRRAMSESVLACHYGQALDLSTRMASLAQRQVPSVVRATTRLKTGSLTQLATRIGALLAGADAASLHALSEFGSEVGIGLQMLDDLSGIYNERRCHKGHEDLVEGRPTWPWAFLAEAMSELEFSRLQQRAREVELHPESVAEQMREALGQQGKLRARSYLAAATHALQGHFGRSSEVEGLVTELSELERSYA